MEVLSSLVDLVFEYYWIAPLLVFLAGVITAFLPCSLVSVPLVMAYVGSKEEKTYSAFKFSVMLGVGTIISNVLLGILVMTVGIFIQLLIMNSYVHLLLGVILLLMVFQLWGFINIIPSTHLVSKTKKKGTLGALIAGFFIGLFSSPCSTPMLVAILTIAVQKGDLVYGILLLFLYSVGQSVLFVVIGVFTSSMKTFMRTTKYSYLITVLKVTMSIFLLGVSIYFIYLGV